MASIAPVVMLQCSCLGLMAMLWEWKREVVVVLPESAVWLGVIGIQLAAGCDL